MVVRAWIRSKELESNESDTIEDENLTLWRNISAVLLRVLDEIDLKLREDEQEETKQGDHGNSNVHAFIILRNPKSSLGSL